MAIETPPEGTAVEPIDINQFLQADLPLLDKYLTLAKATKRYKLNRALLGPTTRKPEILQRARPLTEEEKQAQRETYINSIDAINSALADLSKEGMVNTKALIDRQTDMRDTVLELVLADTQQMGAIVTAKVKGAYDVAKTHNENAAIISRRLDLDHNPDAWREYQTLSLPVGKKGWDQLTLTLVGQVDQALGKLDAEDGYVLLKSIEEHLVRVGLPVDALSSAIQTQADSAASKNIEAVVQDRAQSAMKRAYEAGESMYADIHRGIAETEKLIDWAARRGISRSAKRFVEDKQTLEDAGLWVSNEMLADQLAVAGEIDPEVFEHMKEQIKNFEDRLKALDSPNPPPALIAARDAIIASDPGYRAFKEALGIPNAPDNIVFSKYIQEGKAYARRAGRKLSRSIKRGEAIPDDLRALYESTPGAPELKPVDTPSEGPESEMDVMTSELDGMMDGSPVTPAAPTTPTPGATSVDSTPPDTGPQDEKTLKPPPDETEAKAIVEDSGRKEAIAAATPRGQSAKSANVAGAQTAVDEPEEDLTSQYLAAAAQKRQARTATIAEQQQQGSALSKALSLLRPPESFKL